METNSNGFEIATCSRCGGSGKHSYNQMDGDRCYGCGGSGKVFTKRGAAARKFYKEQMQVVVSNLTVGDYIFESVSPAGARRWMRVEGIYQDALNADRVTIKLQKISIGTFWKSTVESIKTEEQRLGYLAKAITYQATLGINGKPMSSTLPNVNKAIAALGIAAELVKGEGYFYFVGDAISLAESSSVMVYRVSELTVAQWLEELQSFIKENKA